MNSSLDHDVWETLPDQRSKNEANNAAYLVETARSVAHHAEQIGRPEDGSSREKAEAPAEVAAQKAIRRPSLAP